MCAANTGDKLSPVFASLTPGNTRIRLSMFIISESIVLFFYEVRLAMRGIIEGACAVVLNTEYGFYGEFT